LVLPGSADPRLEDFAGLPDGYGSVISGASIHGLAV